MNSGLAQERKQSVVQTDKRQHSDRRQPHFIQSCLHLKSVICLYPNAFSVNEK